MISIFTELIRYKVIYFMRVLKNTIFLLVNEYSVVVNIMLLRV